MKSEHIDQIVTFLGAAAAIDVEVVDILDAVDISLLTEEILLP